MTNKLLEMMDEGVLDPRLLAESALRYMSEDDVADMAWATGIVYEDDEEDADDDDSMDGDHESALASAGFGTDEDYGYFGGDE
jgi:hypothetical protein